MPDFKYLGSILIPNGQAKDKIAFSITIARNAYFRWTKPLLSCR